MQVYDGLGKLPQKPAAVALGNFDGVHLGHQQVLRSAAMEGDLQSTVLLFHNHPAVSLGRTPPLSLITPRQRNALFAGLGIEALCTVDFEQIRTLSGEAFVCDVLMRRLHAKALFCGFNYRCGKGAAYGPKELMELCQSYGLRLTVLPALYFENAPVSSTRIRAALEQGDVVSASRMLGRPFTYDFEVVSGDRRGRLLGFPTINQFFPESFVKLRFGVYASRAFVDGAWHASVTNYGSRPTFDGKSVRSETCILNYKGDLYGQHVPVSLLRFLRGEQHFPSFEAIQAQIAEDSEKANRIFMDEGGRAHE